MMSKPPIKDSGKADGASADTDPSENKENDNAEETSEESVDGDLPIGMPVSAEEYKKLKEKSKKAED